MTNLNELDYMEIIDMPKAELMKHSKKELLDLIYQQAAELFEAEKKLNNVWNRAGCSRRIITWALPQVTQTTLK